MLFGLFKKYVIGFYKLKDSNTVVKLEFVDYGLFNNKYYYRVVGNINTLFKSELITCDDGEMFTKENMYNNAKIIGKINSIHNALFECNETYNVYWIKRYIRNSSSKRFNSALIENLITKECKRVRLHNLYSNYRKMC